MLALRREVFAYVCILLHLRNLTQQCVRLPVYVSPTLKRSTHTSRARVTTFRSTQSCSLEVVVDGRQDWYSTGVKGYEVYRIAKKLGGWNCTRFDGGGSSCMWLYDNGAGKLVNSVSDSRGERSCRNYLLIKEK